MKRTTNSQQRMLIDLLNHCTMNNQMQTVLLQKGSEFCGRISRQQQHLIRFVSLVGALSVIISQLNRINGEEHWNCKALATSAILKQKTVSMLHSNERRQALYVLECGKIGTFQMRNSSRELHDSNLHRALFDYCVYDVLRISLGVVLDFEKRKQQHAKSTFFSPRIWDSTI
jgi:hypothetical protein